jgi:hypothetical protein
MNKSNIKTDPEFRDLLSPLADEEEKLLRSSIQHEGCLQPLIVEQGLGLLIDGHNRFRICNELDIPFDVKSVSIGSKEQAKRWIIQNQLGRRNITKDKFDELIGELYNSLKTRDAANPGFKEGHEFEGNQHEQNVVGVQNDPQPETSSAAKQVATAHGVSEKKAKREGRLNEKIAEHNLKGVPRGEAKKIIKEKEPRKQTKAEAREEAEVMAENPEIFKEEKANEKYQQSNGLGIAATAISLLGRISETDTQRREAFDKVINYCSKKLSK